MSQKITYGTGSIVKLKEILKENRPSKIFLVTGKESYKSSGAEKQLTKILKEFEYIRFFDFKVLPQIENIEKGIERFKTEHCDFVIGIGGGSVIDIAKAISVLACNNGRPTDYIIGKIKLNDKKIPSVIIPTTSGTGSESTHFSVVYIDKTKFSLTGKSILPDYVILDCIFTNKLSTNITASSGMDALCQGIESFWSVNSTEESKKYSIKALTYALDYIEDAVNKPNEECRKKMLEASNYSGRAINIAKTTAAHAVSYPFTAYFNIPHGHAVALTLPHFIEFNSQVDADSVQDIRGLSFVKQRMSELIERIGEASALDAKNKILSIMNNIGLETKLSNLGFSEKDIDIVIKNGFNPQRVKNNPRILTENQLRKLLIKLL
jgi:alcohol dehydrogenase class IV